MEINLGCEGEGVQIVSLAILAVMMIGAWHQAVLLPNIVLFCLYWGGVFVSIAGMYLLNADFVAGSAGFDLRRCTC